MEMIHIFTLDLIKPCANARNARFVLFHGNDPKLIKPCAKARNVSFVLSHGNDPFHPYACVRNITPYFSYCDDGYKIFNLELLWGSLITVTSDPQLTGGET